MPIRLRTYWYIAGLVTVELVEWRAFSNGAFLVKSGNLWLGHWGPMLL